MSNDPAPGLMPVFDGHNDTILKLERAARDGEGLDFAGGAESLDIDLPRARLAGFVGGFFAMFTPAFDGGEIVGFDRTDHRRYAPVERRVALDFTLAMFARLRRLVAELPDDLALCGSADDIAAAMEQA